MCGVSMAAALPAGPLWPWRRLEPLGCPDHRPVCPEQHYGNPRTRLGPFMEIGPFKDPYEQNEPIVGSARSFVGNRGVEHRRYALARISRICRNRITRARLASSS